MFSSDASTSYQVKSAFKMCPDVRDVHRFFIHAGVSAVKGDMCFTVPSSYCGLIYLSGEIMQRRKAASFCTSFNYSKHAGLKVSSDMVRADILILVSPPVLTETSA